MRRIAFDGKVQRVILLGFQPTVRPRRILGNLHGNVFAQRSDGGEQNGAVFDAITLVASDLIGTAVTGYTKVNRQRKGDVVPVQPGAVEDGVGAALAHDRPPPIDSD